MEALISYMNAQNLTTHEEQSLEQGDCEDFGYPWATKKKKHRISVLFHQLPLTAF
jgi:hypothetical protein